MYARKLYDQQHAVKPYRNERKGNVKLSNERKQAQRVVRRELAQLES